MELNLVNEILSLRWPCVREKPPKDPGTWWFVAEITTNYETIHAVSRSSASLTQFLLMVWFHLYNFWNTLLDWVPGGANRSQCHHCLGGETLAHKYSHCSTTWVFQESVLYGQHVIASVWQNASSPLIGNFLNAIK